MTWIFLLWGLGGGSSQLVMNLHGNAASGFLQDSLLAGVVGGFWCLVVLLHGQPELCVRQLGTHSSGCRYGNTAVDPLGTL